MQIIILKAHGQLKLIIMGSLLDIKALITTGLQFLALSILIQVNECMLEQLFRFFLMKQIKRMIIIFNNHINLSLHSTNGKL